MPIIETERLVLNRLSTDDTGFIYELVNDPDWIKFIGDKNVHSLEDAGGYITEGPVASYQQNGYGLYLVERRADHVPVGICGLIKRDALQDPDVGFAFLPVHRGQGYATESAAAVLAYGRKVLGLERVLAVTAPDNEASIRVLEKIGFRYDKMIQLSDDDPGSRLFVPDV